MSDGLSRREQREDARGRKRGLGAGAVVAVALGALIVGAGVGALVTFEMQAPLVAAAEADADDAVADAAESTAAWQQCRAKMELWRTAYGEAVSLGSLTAAGASDPAWLQQLSVTDTASENAANASCP